MSYCLPRSFVARFSRATAENGPLDPIRLKNMDSASRRAELTKVFGDEEHAKEVNALFEQKLLVRYKYALNDWVSEVINGPEERKNLVDKINGIDARILDPQNSRDFLADLAARRLGATVTEKEARGIFDAAKAAKEAKEKWTSGLLTDVSRGEYFKILRDKGYNVSSDLRQVVEDRNAYGNSLLDLQDLVEAAKGTNAYNWKQGRTYVNLLVNTLTMPKTLATGILHFSALGVQAWGLISHKVTWEAFVEQFKYFYDENNYRQLQSYMVSHPDYKFAVDGKLGLTDVSDKLSSREEDIQSSFLQDANKYVADKSGLPINVLGASSRAFTGFLNYTRFNRFVDLLNAARNVDPDSVAIGSQTVKDLASVVNNFTGRAKLGPDDKFSNLQPVLNTIFFAPRKILATVNMFSPVEVARLAMNGYKTGNYVALQAHIRQLVGSIMATGALLYLANAMGYSVDYNSTSQDFLKIQTPSGEKIDITGGNAIYTRLWARILAGKEVTSKGKTIELGEGYKPTTGPELARTYLRGKLSPVAGLFIDAWLGEDAVGHEFEISSEVRNRIEPIVMENFINYYRQQPEKSIADIPILSGIFGVNVESPMPPTSASGRTFWGDPTSVLHDPARTELDQKMDQLGVYENIPPKAINGIKLTDDQYHEYVTLYGMMNKQRLSSLFNDPSFNAMSKGNQRVQVQSVLKMSRDLAQARISAAAKGSSNDVIKKSMDKQIKDIQGLQ